MDINSMLSGGPPAGGKQSPRSRVTTPSAVSNVQQSVLQGQHGSHHQAPTPAYQPQLGAGARSGQGITPLHTSNQAPVPGQYSLSQQPLHSPDAVQGQQYRFSEYRAAVTPAALPSSHGYPHPVPPGVSSNIHGLPTSSVSPTPSSHHSATPHSVRQSPFSSTNQPPPSQQPLYHQSQPNTPLGPPSLLPQRSTFSDAQSPVHHRTYSGTSNGMVAGSPAQRQPSVGNLIDSPDPPRNISPHMRRTSEQNMRGDRDRSISVSPKTVPHARPSSMGSRHSSQQDFSSTRSSVQMNAISAVASPIQTMQPQKLPGPLATQQSGPRLPFPDSEVAHSSQIGYPSSTDPLTASGASLSSQAHHQPQPISHHSQRMDMNHLLTPTSEVPPRLDKGANKPHSASADYLTNTIATPISQPSQPSSQMAAGVAAHPLSGTSQSMAETQALNEQSTQSNGRSSAGRKAEDTRAPLKRPAEYDLSQPTTKQRRMRKYQMPPPWARYSKHNHRFARQQQEMKENGHDDGPQNIPQSQPRSNGNGAPAHHPEGQISNDSNVPDGRTPWLNNPPLDYDLINARRLLGEWEKTFMWNTPYPDLLRVVQDWIFVTLESLQDVGRSAHEGAIEIEAKIGTLLDRDDERCKLPVTTSTVIHPGANKNYRFESQMTKAEHKAMNDFLNTSIRDTMQKGRCHMNYKHLYELDTFLELSPSGMRVIPPALQKRQSHRDPKLRTTTELDKHGQPQRVKARIVKVNVDNLHIFNPMHRYDCRISINLEVNFNHLTEMMKLDPAELTLEPTDARPPELARNKDRVSYKHLAYSVDLTKVEISGLQPKFELELEVDADLLREHHRRLKAGEPSAFGDIVSGFLDNATFLMRQRAPSE